MPVAQFPPPYPQNLEWSPTELPDVLLAEGIAVSDKNNHIYVADSGRGVIFDYSSTADIGPGPLGRKHHPVGSFGGSSRLGGGRQRDG